MRTPPLFESGRLPSLAVSTEYRGVGCLHVLTVNRLLHADSILKRIEEDGFQIAMQREIILTEEQAREFYKEHEGQDYFPALLEQMTRCAP